MPLLFFEPIFMKRIWGDHYFKKELKYPLDDELYGELWSLSAVKDAETKIINGEFKGKTLSEIFLSNPELFNFDFKEFPLLIKLIHTSDLLSVQVHPDDEYAKVHENQLGKTECWYFLDAKDDSFIYYGHHAKSPSEFIDAIKVGKCEELLDKYTIHQDDFAYIPSKTIHAIGKNILLLEIQQSSNITYRLYDYNRLGLDGKPRELHVEKAMQVIDFGKENEKIKSFKDQFGEIVDGKYFKIHKFKVDGKTSIILKDNVFYTISVIKGTIKVEDQTLNIGESLLTTADINQLVLDGNGEILITKPKQ